jgi:hypothetical protein
MNPWRVATLAFGAIWIGCAGPDPMPGPAGGRFDDVAPGGSGFLAGAREHIASREYWASPTGAGLQAPNRQHDLRTFRRASSRASRSTSGRRPRARASSCSRWR